MATREIIKAEKVLLEQFRNKGLSVSKIIVFGSYAKGEGKKDSDIDIIIVSKDFRNKDIFERVEMTRGIHRELVKKTMKPFDILYYSDIEWKSGNSLIINIAKTEGKIIYSA